METTFMIIDDDINIIKMVERIININQLGKVVTSLSSGKDSVDEILFYNPDIILIDYLLPLKDGAEIVKEAIERGNNGKFIMISNVEDESMISNAYNKGVLFFIKKPINSIELIKVVKNAIQTLELERSMSLIQNVIGKVAEPIKHVEKVDYIKQIEFILSDIGIIGVLGSVEIVNIIDKIIIHKKKHPTVPYKLHEIYLEIANENNSSNLSNINSRTIEQRIRRAIQKALSNLAEIGLDDFCNPIFVDYSNLLFYFKEIKQEMDYIKGSTMYRGKIDIRKFIEGIISVIKY